MVKLTVWKAGHNSTVVTVPVTEKKVKNIEVGDIVEVEFKEVFKTKKELIKTKIENKFKPKL